MIILDFATLVRNQITTIQSTVNGVFNFAIGSTIRAIVESNSTVTMYLSNLVLELLSITRASTSTGADLDSWMNDFGLTRINAAYATGTVASFARFTPTSIATVPVGTTIENTDGSQTYIVIINIDNPNYNPIENAYVLPEGTSSILVPITAVIPGTGANASIGSINVLTQTIIGVDTVTNTYELSNGEDEEDDEAFRVRFINYISSLARATKDAVLYAVLSAGLNITCIVVENYSYSGDVSTGYFYVVVDDGTGYPPTELLDLISTKIDAVRPLGSAFAVYAPIVVIADVVATVTVSGPDGAAIRADVVIAVTNFLNSLELDEPCPYTVLAQIIYNVSPLITNVTGVLLNSGVLDLTTTNHEVIKAGTVGID